MHPPGAGGRVAHTGSTHVLHCRTSKGRSSRVVTCHSGSFMTPPGPRLSCRYRNRHDPTISSCARATWWGRRAGEVCTAACRCQQDLEGSSTEQGNARPGAAHGWGNDSSSNSNSDGINSMAEGGLSGTSNALIAEPRVAQGWDSNSNSNNHDSNRNSRNSSSSNSRNTSVRIRGSKRGAGSNGTGNGGVSAQLLDVARDWSGLAVWRGAGVDGRRGWGDTGPSSCLAAPGAEEYADAKLAGSLVECALQVLNTASPTGKAALTHRAWRAYCGGTLPLHPTTHASANTRPGPPHSGTAPTHTSAAPEPAVCGSTPPASPHPGGIGSEAGALSSALKLSPSTASVSFSSPQGFGQSSPQGFGQSSPGQLSRSSHLYSDLQHRNAAPPSEQPSSAGGPSHLPHQGAQAAGAFCNPHLPYPRAPQCLAQPDLSPPDLAPPERPARPDRPRLVPARQVPSYTPGGPGLPLSAHLLHNLAHIELNAIDLAWDTVARFAPLRLPDAFYTDFARVADDESRHLGWCLQRLAELGHSYGDMVAHDLLWEGAQLSAGDLNARLAVIPLSQEARGLDAGTRLASRLVGSGDRRSAAIVTAIAMEERAHVAVGVAWFRRVCEVLDMPPDATFRAWLSTLCPDLLKGPFNRSERALVGLPQHWYDTALWPEEEQRAIVPPALAASIRGAGGKLPQASEAGMRQQAGAAAGPCWPPAGENLEARQPPPAAAGAPWRHADEDAEGGQQPGAAAGAGRPPVLSRGQLLALRQRLSDMLLREAQACDN